MPEPVAIFTLVWPWISRAALGAIGARGSQWLTLGAEETVRQVQVRLRVSPVDTEGARRLAWTTYVQVTTRISVVPMPNDHGFDREGLDSLHELFGALRGALVEAGPGGASRQARDGTPIGVVVVVVLNVVLRPFLSYWHPRLERHEAGRPACVSTWDHEQAWPEHAAFREQLGQLRDGLARLAHALEVVLDIDGLASLRELGRVPELDGAAR